MNNQIGLNTEKLFTDFIAWTDRTVQQGNHTQRFLMEITEVTKEQNTMDGQLDTVPLILFQDYYFRVTDPTLASGRAENSPMALPLLLVSLPSGLASVRIFKGAWSSVTVEEVKVKRMHESDSKLVPAYELSYKTIKVASVSEIMRDNEWYTCIMATAGSVEKKYKGYKPDGSFAGNDVGNHDFYTGKARA